MLRHIPMGSYLVGVPVLLGVVYFFAWQRRIDNQADAEPEAALVSKGELIADHHECLGARSEIAPTREHRCDQCRFHPGVNVRSAWDGHPTTELKHAHSVP